MSDVLNWDITDSNNNDAPPDGFPEGMAYSAVNNAARAVMGAVARFYADNNGSLVTTGSGDNYLITTNQAITSYGLGLSLVFRTDRVNTGAATLDLNAIGSPQPLRRESGVDLGSGELSIGAYQAVYNGSEFIVTGSPSTLDAQNISELPAGQIAKTSTIHFFDNDIDFKSTPQGLLDLFYNSSTPDTEVLGADRLLFFDSATEVIREVTADNYFNTGTSTVSGDFFLYYEASTQTLRKISQANLLADELTSLESGDFYVAFDVSEGRMKKISKENAQSDIGAGDVVVEPVATSITVFASAGVWQTVTPTNGVANSKVRVKIDCAQGQDNTTFYMRSSGDARSPSIGSSPPDYVTSPDLILLGQLVGHATGGSIDSIGEFTVLLGPSGEFEMRSTRTNSRVAVTVVES